MAGSEVNTAVGGPLLRAQYAYQTSRQHTQVDHHTGRLLNTKVDHILAGRPLDPGQPPTDWSTTDPGRPHTGRP